MRIQASISSNYELESDRVCSTVKFRYGVVDLRTMDILDKHRKKYGSLKLEVGSGIRPRDGYLHLDLEVDAGKPEVDFSCDFAENNLPSNAFDEIIAIHFLEHVYWMKVPWIMSEFNRLLKPGGKLFVEVPDFEVAKNRPLSEVRLMFDTIYMNNRGDGDGGEKDDFVPGFNHSSCWTEEMLSALARGCGFEPKRRRDKETASNHNWIRVLHLECTKVREPYTVGVLNQHIGIMGGSYKWMAKYTEMHGL